MKRKAEESDDLSSKRESAKEFIRGGYQKYDLDEMAGIVCNLIKNSVKQCSKCKNYFPNLTNHSKACDGSTNSSNHSTCTQTKQDLKCTASKSPTDTTYLTDSNNSIIQQFECEQCNLQFSSLKEYSTHAADCSKLKKPNVDNISPCAIVNNELRESISNEICLWECEFCGFDFKTEETYLQHLKMIHNVTDQNKFHQYRSEVPVTLQDILETDNLKEILRSENEAVLKHIVKPIPEASKLASSDNSDDEPRPSVLTVSVMNVLHELDRSEKDEKNQHIDFMKLVKNKEKRRNTKKMKVLEEKLQKEDELTYAELMQMEESEEGIIDKQMEKFIAEVDGETTTVVDEDMFADLIEYGDYIQTPQSEIDKIVNQCKKNDELRVGPVNYVKLTKYQPKSSVREDPCTAAEYFCHICRIFSSKSFSEFYGHLKVHDIDLGKKKQMQRADVCPICSYLLPQKNLLEHMKMHIDHIRCYTCKWFIPISDFDSHVKGHEMHFECPICGEFYSREAAVRQHFSHHKKNSIYSCEECDKKFCSLEKLVRHISLEHRKIDPDYSECPYCFDMTDNIKNHIYSTDCCLLKCKVCAKVKKTVEAFRKHMEHHNDGRTRSVTEVAHDVFKCDECNLVVADESKFETHCQLHQIFSLYSENVVRTKLVWCDLCDLKMPEGYLYFHGKQHESFVRCPTCFKFVLSNNIDCHIQLHETDVSCDLCGESFCGLNVKKRDDHRWSHGRKLKRPCAHCNLVFSSELSRVIHVSLVHMRIDPDFAYCYYCSDVVSRSNIHYHLFDNLACQRRCKICKQSFTSELLYKSHVKNAHHSILKS